MSSKRLAWARRMGQCCHVSDPLAFSAMPSSHFKAPSDHAGDDGTGTEEGASHTASSA